MANCVASGRKLEARDPAAKDYSQKWRSGFDVAEVFVDSRVFYSHRIRWAGILLIFHLQN